MKFWFRDPTKLYKDLNEFPETNSSIEKKVNFVTSSVIILSIILAVVTGIYDIIYFPLIFMLFTILIFWKESKKVKCVNADGNECKASTIDNPFGNVLITDDRDRPEALNYNKNTKQDIEKNFNTNLYLDSDDMFGRSSSRRQFYTMPSTTIPNKQGELADWLYSQPATIFKDEHIEA
ncbi:hypothetical protein JO84_gp147 [Aureococcus anophagefferens virus]|uniref:Minor capsid protein P9 transmembrane helices domain-containing protein n=1 Tax=Aureococcus anophagefferens virus TaxID=1474867 RepID=A0A076FMA8_9VIRU|nr:hypothetical protein JO84_gp147 [Aureococcus anophagefferens virus]AII17033.1 hypothetical protein AaV_328 [Aureococcus anophagefferens virus]UOG94242.1 hypothetical protein MKD35_201 [Aureococcus anophagefferens virus]